MDILVRNIPWLISFLKSIGYVLRFIITHYKLITAQKNYCDYPGTYQSSA